MNTLVIASAALAVVAFKDAAKIKSWDAWDDHKASVAWTEKRSVTRERIAKMDPGLKDAGTLPVRDPAEIRSDVWSVGCECLDRDYADWDQYKRFLRELTWGKCEKDGKPVHVFWFSGERPGDSLEYARADLSFAGDLTDCTWADLLSGKTGVLDDAKSVPLWDSPIMVSRCRSSPQSALYANRMGKW